MLGKPKDNIQPNAFKTSTPTNLIGKRFSQEFEVLLDRSYYHGSRFSQVFNVIDDEGRSNVYVKDPYEDEIEKFDKSELNEMKFMVGLTGMGKTTLIKNYYRTTSEEIRYDNNQYVIYISFYRSNLSLDKPYESVSKEVETYLLTFVEKLIRDNSNLLDLPDFWVGLYNYISDNKKVLLAGYRLTPRSKDIDSLRNSFPTEEEKLDRLEKLSINSPLEYYSSLIKYVLQLLSHPYKITLIFDDIEAKDFVFHNHIIEIARHMFSCLNATTDYNSTVKVLVALRAYTFRSNVDRIAEARRETLQRDVILKKDAVPMHDIFESRFSAIKNKRIKNREIGNIDSYSNAKRVLDIVEAKLNKIGSDLIFNLQNYNLCDSMVLYSKILTNLEWISCGEQQLKGTFKLFEENYRITTYNLIRAIGMGNYRYYDGSSTCIPNIIQYNEYGTEMVCLYVIRYLINMKFVGVYGEQYIEGKELFQEMIGLFCNANMPDPIKHKWKNQFDDAISFLFYKGLLFRSLYDIEDESRSQIRREYYDSYKLYLAPRGELLYKLLANNSVLMELYRDDICVDLPNNSMVTSELSTFERFEYILGIIKFLFETEKRNIAQALWNILKYTEEIGKTFICEHILTGIVNNINSYYGDHDENHEKIVNEIISFTAEMREYALAINSRYCDCFDVSGLDKLDNALIERP